MSRTGRKGLNWFLASATVVGVIIAMGAAGCAAQPVPAPPSLNVSGSSVYNPAIWGRSYPDEYRTWLKTQNDRPRGKSVYKRGGAGGATYDKLSEYPYLALLYAGWGFGVEYNEPRGHMHMLNDQVEIDKSRLKSGGVCLTCKTPYSPKMFAEKGPALFSMPYEQAAALITSKDGRIGPTCVDCHDPANMELKPLRTADLEQLRTLGKTDLNYGDIRSLVCAQCHSSYIITRDLDMKANGLILPWKYGAWGALSVEGMIAEIENDPANLEWKQSVTGLKLGFIRHPEYEMYSNGSTHWAKSVACSSCHMEINKNARDESYFSHNVISPLATDMRQCLDCHVNLNATQLRSAALTIQKESVREMNTAGYATAVAAKLIERVNALKTSGVDIDSTRLASATADYRQAFYRVVFLAAENSVGFHNPAEAHRIARDAAQYASRAQQSLSVILADAGAPPPATIDLELTKYLDNRGDKKLEFDPSLEFKDAGAFPDILLMSYKKGL